MVRCSWDVDDSPFDNRCLRGATYLFDFGCDIPSHFCLQHAKLLKSLCASVESENVTWRQPGMKPRTFRLWTDEETYSTVSRQMKFLVSLKLVKCQMAAGYQFVTRGYCELTTAGRRALP